MAMRMRAVEGQYGTVQAFVVPQASPCICKAAVHIIKPLCMHHRINSWDDSTAMNELLITGDIFGKCKKQGHEHSVQDASCAQGHVSDGTVYQKWCRLHFENEHTSLCNQPGSHGRPLPLLLLQNDLGAISRLLIDNKRIHSFCMACNTKGLEQMCPAGIFDVLDGHAWLVASLPDVPPRAPTPDGGIFCFQGTVHESLLVW